MAELSDVMVYFCTRYPHKSELSKARLTKMVYLADWKAAINLGRQITDVEWIFNHYGPYVEDVIDTARGDTRFVVKETITKYGHMKELISCMPDAQYKNLTDSEMSILDFVIETTRRKYWNDFIKLVYSTYPVVSQPRFSQLDLVGLACEYRAMRVGSP